jgi:putative transposase
MKKTRFSEEKIAYILRQVDAETTAIEVCRQNGISEQTFYRWKIKYAGLGVAEVRRLRQLEEENTKLKQMVADLSLDKVMLQEVIAKKL